MRNMRFVIGASMFVLFFSSLPVRAGYLMDCSKASTKIEKQICANRELWHLDGLLDRHYAAAIARGGDLDELRRGQRRWLREVRDRCDSDECLRKVYKVRVDFLERWEFSDPYCGEHTYPPYPDVWGYDAGRFGVSSGTLYKLPSGEFWLEYLTGKNHKKKQYIRCFFGSNSIDTRGNEERRRYFSYGYGHSLLQHNGVSLPDGSTLMFGHTPSGARCDNGFGIYLEKKGPDGKVEKRLSFLIPLSAPQVRPVSGCEGAPQGSSVVVTSIGNASVSDAVVLADDTILVSGGDRLYPFVIRFDNDLNTKFDSNRILIVDYTDIEAIERESDNYQELADLVHEYVTRKLQEDK